MLPKQISTLRPVLYSMQAIDSSSYKAEKKMLLKINFTRPVGRVLYEFQSSKAKTYSSQTRVLMSESFCPGYGELGLGFIY